MNIKKDLTELIGNTPLLELRKITRAHHSKANIIVKIEKTNPGGSSKDRIALSMIERAEANGTLLPGGTIIEPTSGNTGVGLAWIAAVKGYKAIFTMPETMSKERQDLLKAYGAQIILTPGPEGMNGAINKAKELHKEIKGSVILQQFENPANPAIHLKTTAKEIWEDTDGKVNVFIAGVGTGGTISGTGLGLKQLNPEIEIIAVEPDTSAVLSGSPAGKHSIQGIGAGFIPSVYNPQVIDKIIRIKDEEAIQTTRELAYTEGLLVGISSGAALKAALKIGLLPEYAGKNIVVLLPDTGERYLSTNTFNSIE